MSRLFTRSISRRQSIALVCGLLVVFFTGGILLVRQRTAQQSIPVGSLATPVPAATTEAPQSSGFVLDRFHRSQIKDGRTLWEVTGKQGQYFPLENKAVIVEAHLTLSRNPDELVTMTAGKATLFLQGSDLTVAEIVDDVHVDYKGEVSISTNLAVYDKAADTVTAPGVVNVTHATADVRGTGLVANLSSQEFTLTQNVETVIKPRSKKQ